MSFLNLAPAMGNPKFCWNSISNDSDHILRRNLISMLQNSKDMNHARSIHAKIIRKGIFQDPFLVFELVRLYCKINSIDYATKVFHHSENPNVYLYTALIDGLVSLGFFTDALNLYTQMINQLIFPDEYVITSVLKACALLLALGYGKGVHCQVLKFGLSLNRSIALKLMGLYGKCGRLEDARNLFDKMSERDVVACTVMITCYFDHGLTQEAMALFSKLQSSDTVYWTAMIDGLVKNGELTRALEIFREMQENNVNPNEVTIVCVLYACMQLGALELGRWVHMYMSKCDIKLNQFIGGALVNMYSRCGDIDAAKSLFKMLKVRDLTTYNSMIVGLAMHGKSIEAIGLFREMIKRRLVPNSITFVGVLNACSHGGLVELGYEIFQSMETEYRIEPQVQHYGCIVDLLARVGRLEEAYDFIGKMGVHPDDRMLCALLSACKIHRNAKIGDHVAKLLSECNSIESGSYIMLSNFYASSGRWNYAAKVRKKMEKGGILKEPGCSSIEVNSVIHEFFSGDLRHPQRKRIYEKLEELNYLTRLEGYIPATKLALHDVDDKQKEWALAVHSEKLAICYGLISTEPCTTLRIMKNIRICNDCHSMIKLIAKITGRKIVVRDRNRFHHFENGVCSCKDYW
ncbi:putative pentatricopeptide repeat-containing protein At5g59200, chloroplastic [Prosopis cineraria]|uniref:putative pentatricopeptide repeat-containing protein At5g59200, chloroplastic n=1 Tax=Prosopis cineraria TaxID=364024 RepID=UPI002410942A|nr:putative pentatricopeptide repeat-containing protein At5g59200, chloroplastic [Prosopis cineraria]